MSAGEPTRAVDAIGPLDLGAPRPATAGELGLPEAAESFRLESSNSIWLFDPDRMRFRRVPRGTDPDSPSVAADWEPYFGLDVEADGTFTVALNDDGTRRLRAVRVEAQTPEDRTAEIALQREPS